MKKFNYLSMNFFYIEVDAEDDPKHHKKHETRNTKIKMLIPKGRPQRNKRMLMLFIQWESIRVWTWRPQHNLVCTAVMTVVHMCTNMR